MHSDSDGRRPQVEKPILYALVIYLPDPLGEFLDQVRIEMIPGCNPHAHVSVLPPRPLAEPPQAAIAEARKMVAGFAPFDVELGTIDKFSLTDVIYISVTGGAEMLYAMHHALNRGSLAFEEPFAYHPHVTIAQEIPAGQVDALFDLAVRRWREYSGPRRFRVEATVFVRNTGGDLWIDLAEAALSAAPVRPRA